jgi:hypothetical protein
MNKLAREEMVIEESAMLSGVGVNATRMGVTPNPADPRTAYTTLQLGQTVGGRQAVLKMLHPCMENCNAVVKIPDGAVSTSVVLERRDEYELSNQTTTADLLLWNLIVVTNPLLGATQVAIQWPATSAATEVDIWKAYTSALARNPPVVYPAWSTAALPSATFYFSILGSTTLSPNIFSDQTGLSLSGLVKNIRRTYLGSTSELDAPTLNNQGRVISGQWNPDVSLVTKEIKTGDVLTDVFDYYVIQAPAMTSSSVVQSDEFSREAQALSGSYAPLRPCAPTFELTPSTEFRRVDVDYAGAGDEIVDGTEYSDLFLRGWSIQVELWLGISTQGNIRIKRREGLELVPAPDSDYGPFATPALPNDVRAKQILEEFCRTSPHSYPADYNDLGEMIPNILGGIADVIGGLGLPLISPVANFAKGLLPQVSASRSMAEVPMPLYPRAPEQPQEDMDRLVMVLKKLLR